MRSCAEPVPSHAVMMCPPRHSPENAPPVAVAETAMVFVPLVWSPFTANVPL